MRPLEGSATPKLGGGDPSRSFYRYYAGFSERFVQDAIHSLALDEHAVIFDPWNGAGTTTTVAARAGYRTIGLDLNPVLVAIATARALSPDRALRWLDIVRSRTEAHDRGILGIDDDPLLTWFGDGFVRSFRTLQLNALEAVASEPSRKAAGAEFAEF